MLHIIGLVVSINSSSRASFFGSLCYTTSPEKNIPAVKKGGNNLQPQKSNIYSFNLNRFFRSLVSIFILVH